MELTAKAKRFARTLGLWFPRAEVAGTSWHPCCCKTIPTYYYPTTPRVVCGECKYETVTVTFNGLAYSIKGEFCNTPGECEALNGSYVLTSCAEYPQVSGACYWMTELELPCKSYYGSDPWDHYATCFVTAHIRKVGPSSWIFHVGIGLRNTYYASKCNLRCVTPASHWLIPTAYSGNWGRTFNFNPCPGTWSLPHDTKGSLNPTQFCNIPTGSTGSPPFVTITTG